MRNQTDPDRGDHPRPTVASLVQLLENANVPLNVRKEAFKLALPHLPVGALMHSKAQVDEAGQKGQHLNWGLNWATCGRGIFPDAFLDSGWAQAVSLPGYLAWKGQWGLLEVALGPIEGCGKDPLALLLPDGREIGLVQFICMERASVVHALHDTIQALALPLQALQTCADDLYRATSWTRNDGRERIRVALAGSAGDNDQVVAMAALAAHGVSFDLDLWTLGGKDPLTQGVARRTIPNIDARIERLQLAGIDQLAEQGFGRQVKPTTDGPLHIAARRLDVGVMSCLLGHGFDPQAEGMRSTTPQVCVAKNTVPLSDPTRGDRMERCTTLLRAASARQAARQALAGWGLSDAPA